MYTFRKCTGIHSENYLFCEKNSEEVNVVISGKRCGTRIVGVKSNVALKGFFITFTADDGRVFEFKVEEELYLSLEEGQKGSIAIVNDNFYGFCPEE